jgi:hypothetical protein
MWAYAKYTLLFLTGDALPEVRATEAGWMRIKTETILLASEWLAEGR